MFKSSLDYYPSTHIARLRSHSLHVNMEPAISGGQQTPTTIKNFLNSLDAMPKGRYPFRRTLEFLSSGQIILKPSVKTVLLSYSVRDNSKGIR